MLKGFVKLSTPTAQVSVYPTIKNAPRMIELTSEILDILTPFGEATKEILGSEYIIGSLITPLATIIESVLNILNPKQSVAKVLFEKFLSCLKDRSA
ncbi:hypothetical protein AVEN_164837-1 [Araneus ventricosus]|uniref:Uncharacterized protein n=1 Tax=Araneus ventricosus TaxID=182803 RepID=A0A4Y2GMJ2_ARAVE|nr:hypothetical protein AVEN_164837-1 [Araneus ventricosus]